MFFVMKKIVPEDESYYCMLSVNIPSLGIRMCHLLRIIPTFYMDFFIRQSDIMHMLEEIGIY